VKVSEGRLKVITSGRSGWRGQVVGSVKCRHRQTHSGVEATAAFAVCLHLSQTDRQHHSVISWICIFTARTAPSVMKQEDFSEAQEQLWWDVLTDTTNNSNWCQHMTQTWHIRVQMRRSCST